LENKMQKPTEVLNIFEKYTPRIDGEIKTLLAEQKGLLMYDMMSYFFGYLDEDLKETSKYGGKRFRSGICMLLADLYGNVDEALEVASSIEIFHNFTLIHDDIADGDLVRRGRATVWNKWGINHGINTGDAQLLLSTIELNKYITRNVTLGTRISEFIAKGYLKVAEGQFLDFRFSDLPLGSDELSEANTMEMIGKKSGILVGIPAKCAGLLTGQSDQECELLYEYGFNLGLAYQLADDLMSIWGNIEQSGKDELMDLYDKKKTLPIIYLYNYLEGEDKERLVELYSKTEKLTAEEVSYVKALLDQAGAEKYLLAKALENVSIVESSIEKLSLAPEHKELLNTITRALLPNVCGGDAC